MAKPILLIGVPNKMFTSQFSQVAQGLKKELFDYHVLFYETLQSEMQFKVLTCREIKQKDLTDCVRKISEFKTTE